jgi:hypothetical protein
MCRFIVILLALTLAFSTCGCAKRKVIDGVKYDYYGWISRSDKKNPEIEYRVVWGNVIWGTILSETIVAPVYFFGYALCEPIGKKPPIKGQVVE